MAKVYQIIEPRLLSSLMDNYAVPILYWLTEELYKELGDTLANVEMDVIQAGRFGTNYPAIGILDKPLDFDFKNVLIETSNRLLRERPISEIIDFIASTKIDWNAVTTELMKDNFNPALWYRAEVRLKFHSFQPPNDLNMA